MKIGDPVVTNTDIESWTKPFVPQNTEGIVTEMSLWGVVVSFTLPGVLGGTRQVTVVVARDQVEPLN
ncbi:hypothetical protein LO772_08970 [Yinghuangia sp. ASG 101]|uniref:hypothetical protein n=1 Tax=Yinghuangia sp. ASG 101 TaxID=2896848 RepID=UPI001E3AD074|nr:hypothetical protein [Yinghuangia sp. ASG 101]UGQ13709.1 hypothetical protein LO772_08970 [Yinghuangia sp. ASG 101]